VTSVLLLLIIGASSARFWLHKQSEPLFQVHLYRLAYVLANRLSRLGFDRQHVLPITHGRERGIERAAIDLATNFDEPLGSEELR
jgi:hypothetical protein